MRHTGGILVSLAGVITLVSSAPCQAQDYTISTAAGGANPYFYSGTGDGGPATNSGLANPVYDVAVDQAGNLYITAGALIRKVALDGTISTVAGGGLDLGDGVQATQAALAPIALTIDSSGNLYIADTAFGLSRVRRINADGTITTVAGGAPCCAPGDGGPATAAYVGIPYGLAVDTVGNLYIAQADSQNNLIRKVSHDGSIVTVAGGGPAGFLGDGGPSTSASLSRPIGVAVDAGGNFYIAEANGNRVRRVTRGGIISTVAGTGAATTSGDGGPANQAAVNAPWHVATDAASNVYITQINDARVRLIKADGTITTIAGNGTQGSAGDGGPAVAATLDRPAGIASGGRGVYIAQESFGIARVRLLSGRPQILPGGVVPVFSSATTIQPGSWISIYGTNLAAGTATWNGDFPKSLGGTSVTIDSRPAYCWFVSPGQINVQAPDDTASGPVSVVVTTAMGSATSTVTLGPYAPSFSLYDSKHAAAIVLTSGPGNSGNGYDYIGPIGALSFPARPVRAGETVVLFGVGFGPTVPPVSAGEAITASAASLTLPQVTIGGATAAVKFGGIIEAGLFQFNVVVPAVSSGDQPLQATIAGETTPGNVLLTVQ